MLRSSLEQHDKAAAAGERSPGSAAIPIPSQGPRAIPMMGGPEVDMVAQSLPPRAPLLSSSPAPASFHAHFSELSLPPPSPPVSVTQPMPRRGSGRSMINHPFDVHGAPTNPPAAPFHDMSDPNIVSSSAPSTFHPFGRHGPSGDGYVPAEEDPSSAYSQDVAGSATLLSILEHDEEMMSQFEDSLHIGEGAAPRRIPAPHEATSPSRADSHFAFIDEPDPM